MNTHNLIIDGNGLAYCEVYSTYQNQIIGKNGKNYGPLVKVLKNIRDYAQSLNANKVWFTLDKQLDTSGTSTNFRKTLLTEYKGHRKEDDRKAIVHEVLDDTLAFCKTLGIPVIQPNSMEADDVIYFLCKNLEGTKTVLTVDEDLLQLIDENVSVFLFTKRKLINYENFRANTKMDTVEQYIKYKAVKGDDSDNIKGIYNYGPVKSANAVLHWDEWFPEQTLENQQLILKNIELIDLSNTKKYCPDEEISYKKQLDSINCEFDHQAFLKLSKYLEINHALSASSSIWQEVFQSTDDLDDIFSTL